MNKVDYIIVGQGLAGSAVAVQLLKLRKKVLVVDKTSMNSSSRIAAGLFNPITGKKMVKTWLADKLFPELHDFYMSIEAATGAKFFFPTPLYRPFLSVEELNEWMSNSADPMYAPYIAKIHDSSAYPGVKDSVGGLELAQCGYLNTRDYIDAVRGWISRDGFLSDESFEFDRLNVDDSQVTYKEFVASRIIFCQGIHNNPWFEWLPIRALKGETISVASDFSENVIINRGVYVLPADGNGRQRVGATYNFQDKLEEITLTAQAELLERLEALITYPFEVKEQQWGWRPTTPDRRPMLGVHPEHQRMIVFNGLGTKGVSLAPHFSNVLIRWLENQVPLDKVVDIERYKSLYWKSP